MKVVPAKEVTPELVQEARELVKRAGLMEEKIINRIHYIMTSDLLSFQKE